MNNIGAGYWVAGIMALVGFLAGQMGLSVLEHYLYVMAIINAIWHRPEPTP